MKSLPLQAVREWTNKEKQLRLFVEKSKRAELRGASNVGESVGAAPPMFTRFANLISESADHNHGSLFEAKAGLRVARVVPSEGDPVGAILSSPATKAIVRSMKMHMKSAMLKI